MKQLSLIEITENQILRAELEALGKKFTALTTAYNEVTLERDTLAEACDAMIDRITDARTNLALLSAEVRNLRHWHDRVAPLLQ